MSINYNVMISPNKYFGRIKNIRLIVIHTMEVSEDDLNVAEAVGRAFLSTARKASCHVGIDQNSFVRSVEDKDTAWACPGANSDGLQLELAGRAGQVSGQWNDAASRAILENGAQQVADWVTKYNIPIKHLTEAELRAGQRGIIGHVDASRVYKLSSHWDPGTSFPWTEFLDRVRALVGGSAPVSSALSAPVATAPAVATYDNGPFSKDWIKVIQQKLKRLGYQIADDGYRGNATISAVTDFQTKNGLAPDGWPGKFTNAKLDQVLAVPARPGVIAPAFPLADNEYFGPKSGPKNSISGFFSHRNDLLEWQKQMQKRGWHISADGLYGDQTGGVAELFQREKGLTVDRKIGKQTWAAAWTAPITS